MVATMDSETRKSKRQKRKAKHRDSTKALPKSLTTSKLEKVSSHSSGSVDFTKCKAPKVTQTSSLAPVPIAVPQDLRALPSFMWSQQVKHKELAFKALRPFSSHLLVTSEANDHLGDAATLPASPTQPNEFRKPKHAASPAPSKVASATSSSSEILEAHNAHADLRRLIPQTYINKALESYSFAKDSDCAVPLRAAYDLIRQLSLRRVTERDVLMNEMIRILAERQDEIDNLKGQVGELQKFKNGGGERKEMAAF